jgi:hypothetical protein
MGRYLVLTTIVDVDIDPRVDIDVNIVAKKDIYPWMLTLVVYIGFLWFCRGWYQIWGFVGVDIGFCNCVGDNIRFCDFVAADIDLSNVSLW